MTIPTRSGLDYHRAEDQEDRQVYLPDITRLISRLEEFDSNCFESVRLFRAVERSDLSGFGDLTERLHFLEREFPGVLAQAKAKIIEALTQVRHYYVQGDYRAVTAHSSEIFRCIGRTEELIESIRDLSILLPELAQDLRHHE